MNESTAAAAATTTSAAPAATTQTAAADTAATTAVDWITSLSQDHKGFIENKGFQDPSSIIDSYRNLEKLIGAPKERLLQLPEKEDDPTWKDIYTRLGRPEKPEEYQLKALEGDEGSEEFINWARGAFHELNLTKKQAETLNAKMNDYHHGIYTKGAEVEANIIKEEEAALKKEWGAAYDQNTRIARKAAVDLQIDADTIDGLEAVIGFDATMKLVHKLGSYIKEDSFVIGDSKGFDALSPAAALDKLSRLKQDPDFVKRYTIGDYTARAEMERLHKMAYPGDQHAT